MLVYATGFIIVLAWLKYEKCHAPMSVIAASLWPFVIPMAMLFAACNTYDAHRDRD